jgi:hypothetical protein
VYVIFYERKSSVKEEIRAKTNKFPLKRLKTGKISSIEFVFGLFYEGYESFGEAPLLENYENKLFYVKFR